MTLESIGFDEEEEDEDDDDDEDKEAFGNFCLKSS
jgi:hypothetical protein